MNAVGNSNIGLIRKRNEDSYMLVDRLGLYVVCDGMGGHRGGDIASQMAIAVINDEIDKLDSLSPVKLNEIIKKANYEIWINGQSNPEYYEMGTTITAALIHNHYLHVSHVGDSRLYLLRKNTIKCITRDHTLAEEMVDNGLLTKQELPQCSYNHILTRALGVSDDLEIDSYSEVLSGGDIILLSTDGLSDMLTDEDILSVVKKHSASLESAVDSLIVLANERGGYDNITAVLISI